LRQTGNAACCKPAKVVQVENLIKKSLLPLTAAVDVAVLIKS